MKTLPEGQNVVLSSVVAFYIKERYDVSYVSCSEKSGGYEGSIWDNDKEIGWWSITDHCEDGMRLLYGRYVDED